MPLKLSQRVLDLPPYLFVEIERKKRAAREAGRDVIDFGVGDPDRPTPNFIVDRLKAAAADAPGHRYPHDRGLPELRRALAVFFQRRYGVQLDPERELLVLIGSKEGLGHLPLAVVNPGETVLVPNPGYPVYTSGTIFAGAIPHALELRADRDWLIDLGAVPADVARRAVLMYVNYPSNPLGAVAPLSFYEQLVDFAREHAILVAADAAYNEMHFGEPAPSILQVPGARDVAIELHSASKTFNMTGWRVGFAAGNAEAIDALARVKSNLDSGQFSAVQRAAMAAYEGYDRPEITAIREMYHGRAEVLVAGLREMGFRVAAPKATFYIWAGLPGGGGSMQAATRLLEQADVVAIPGVGFGSAGEGYLRFALTIEVPRIREAIERMRSVEW